MTAARSRRGFVFMPGMVPKAVWGKGVALEEVMTEKVDNLYALIPNILGRILHRH